MTYSIVARDKQSGLFGVAVQSHYFSVGSVVTWARAGVGAVATQSMAEVSYGPLGLELLAAGKSAGEALRALVNADARAATRQVAMVDSSGSTSVHTGGECIPYAGDASGDGFSVQANLMDNDTIWGAMKDAYQSSLSLDFPERLVHTLKAAESAGGDIRGRQSSALLVVDAKPSANYWSGKLIELRVEDHPSPNEELERLLRLSRAYEYAEKGERLISSKKWEDSERAFQRATTLAPELIELEYWRAISLFNSGKKEEAGRLLGKAYLKDARWKKLTGLLVKSGRLSEEPKIS